jgi:hypothetical protein
MGKYPPFKSDEELVDQIVSMRPVELREFVTRDIASFFVKESSDFEDLILRLQDAATNEKYRQTPDQKEALAYVQQRVLIIWRDLRQNNSNR